MRNAFAKEITTLAEQDPRIVFLSGDIGNKLFDGYKEKNGSRFFNCGVAEANMIGVASGLALSGLRPVAYTITPFITTRVMEQIRVDLCYHKAPAIFAGVGSGLGYASLGPTHHSCEDIAMLRSLPGLTILTPADAEEVKGCLRAALSHNGPTYIRLGKKGEQVVHSVTPQIQIGKSLVVRKGTDVCLIVVGVLLPMALAIADKLATHNISVQVVSAVCLKPFDVDLIKNAFKDFSLVSTLEEHSLIGGFGSAVAEWFVDQEDNKKYAPLLRFGTRDEFLHEAGETEHAHKYFGLEINKISDKILKRLAK